jgi:CRISPR-associated protein Cas6
VHSVHVAGSQNGWERPTHGVENLIQLSRRTKLTVRTPSERAVDLQRDLPGIRLEVGGCPLTVGEGKVRALSRETTLFARYVVGEPGQDEEAFLAATSSTLAALGVRVRKALCGRATALSTPQGPIHTRSLMLADLSLQESFLLQRHGLGHHGLMGCGIFIPHKGVEAVVKDR